MKANCCTMSQAAQLLAALCFLCFFCVPLVQARDYVYDADPVTCKTAGRFCKLSSMWDPIRTSTDPIVNILIRRTAPSLTALKLDWLDFLWVGLAGKKITVAPHPETALPLWIAPGYFQPRQLWIRAGEAEFRDMKISGSQFINAVNLVKLTLTNIIFVNLNAGPAVAASGVTSVVLNNVQVRYSSVFAGSLFAFERVDNVLMDNVLMLGNKVLISPVNFNWCGTITIKNSNFTRNVAVVAGAGVMRINNGLGPVSIDNSVFDDNYAVIGTNAIEFSGSPAPSRTITNTGFTHNGPYHYFGLGFMNPVIRMGGTIFRWGSSNFHNVTFANNLGSNLIEITFMDSVTLDKVSAYSNINWNWFDGGAAVALDNINNVQITGCDFRFNWRGFRFSNGHFVMDNTFSWGNGAYGVHVGFGATLVANQSSIFHNGFGFDFIIFFPAFNDVICGGGASASINGDAVCPSSFPGARSCSIRAGLDLCSICNGSSDCVDCFGIPYGTATQQECDAANNLTVKTSNLQFNGRSPPSVLRALDLLGGYVPATSFSVAFKTLTYDQGNGSNVIPLGDEDYIKEPALDDPDHLCAYFTKFLPNGGSLVVTQCLYNQPTTLKFADTQFNIPKGGQKLTIELNGFQNANGTTLNNIADIDLEFSTDENVVEQIDGYAAGGPNKNNSDVLTRLLITDTYRLRFQFLKFGTLDGMRVNSSASGGFFYDAEDAVGKNTFQFRLHFEGNFSTASYDPDFDILLGTSGGDDDESNSDGTNSDDSQKIIGALVGGLVGGAFVAVVVVIAAVLLGLFIYHRVTMFRPSSMAVQLGEETSATESL